MSDFEFKFQSEYGGMTVQRTHGDLKHIWYAAPHEAPLVAAHLIQIVPGTICEHIIRVSGTQGHKVNQETGEIEG